MSRTPLLLLPGLGSDSALWEAQVRDLADIADVVVGNTLHDATLPGMADRILAAAPPRFALAGLSMGGYLALQIIRQAPERVARLALLDTSARPDTPEQTAQRRATIAAVRAAPDFAAISRMSLPYLIHPAADPSIGDAVVAMGVRVGMETYIGQQQAIIARADSRPLLPGIAVPTIIVVGDADMMTPLPLAEEMTAAIPGAVLHVVANSGHLPSMEQPDIVTRHLRDWLLAPASGAASGAAR